MVEVVVVVVVGVVVVVEVVINVVVIIKVDYFSFELRTVPKLLEVPYHFCTET